MIDPLILGATIRMLVEIYQRCFKHIPCQHKYRLTMHSQKIQYCYDCREKIKMDESFYPRHTR